jgi:hypothetical protein
MLRLYYKDQPVNVVYGNKSLFIVKILGNMYRKYFLLEKMSSLTLK